MNVITDKATQPGLVVAHSLRFRRVGDGYPRRVAWAYDGDLAAAMADSDVKVAATVAEWERAHNVSADHEDEDEPPAPKGWPYEGWAPTCECGANFPREGLPVGSEWRCVGCVIAREIRSQTYRDRGRPEWADHLWQAHWVRFGSVSDRYARRVREAYDGDLERALTDSDEQVAATVSVWERSHGLDPVDQDERAEAAPW